MKTNISSFDYIIVGGGSAGCVLANRISANPKIKVLIIEAGGKDNWHWVKIPAGYLYCMGNPKTDWCFKTEPEIGLNGKQINYPRGKVLGGCSSINGMIYMRGQSSDYDHWRQLGNLGWGWDDVLPYFIKSEDHYLGKNQFHGSGGEVRIEAMRLNWEILEAFRNAAQQAGIAKISDFNTGNNEGSAYYEVTQKRGVRWNAVSAYLKPIRKRTNLTILTNAHVKNIKLEGKTAVGVNYDHNGTDYYSNARHEIVLTAGSIGSPHILQLSGIGKAITHNKIGIKTHHELNGVGKNLQDHMQIRLVYKVNKAPTLNKQLNSFWGKVNIGLKYLFFKTGPLSMAPSQLGIIAKSDPFRSSANLQYHVQPLSLDKFGGPLHDFSGITASVCNLAPESKGFIETVNPNHKIPPRIQANYLSADADKKVAIDAIKLTRNIFSQKSMKPYSPVEYLPGEKITNIDSLIKSIGNISTTMFHPVGTCKMGLEPNIDPDSVVNDKLKVHGLNRLRIADASIMPTIPHGNTNAPVTMIAEKASEFILHDYKNS